MWEPKTQSVNLDEEDLVLVTGATGFLASHVINQLLNDGYRVRGTVRNLKTQQNKINQLRQMSQRLELVEADLNDVDSSAWSKAVKDCKYVIHTAAIPPSTNRAESDLIDQNIRATLNILKTSARSNVILEKFIYTSSVVAISGEILDDGRTYTEQDWPKFSQLYEYSKSKVLTEKALWQFVQEQQILRNWCPKVAVINPGFILGPLLHDYINQSVELIKKIMLRELPFVALPDIHLPVCDVRDAAMAHVRALITSDADFNRHIVTSTYESPSLAQIAQILATKYGDKFSIPTFVLPNALVRIYSIFDKEIRKKSVNLSKKSNFDNGRMKHVLNIKPIDLSQTLVDTVESLFEFGIIPRR